MPESVLIVEDDRDLSLAMAMNLRAEGYRPTVASDAVTALSAARRERPDLILLDLGLPGGDGLDVLSRVRTNTTLATTPVIVLTARDESYRAPVMAAGAQAFFRKPADDKALLAAIAGELGRAMDPLDNSIDRAEAISLLRELLHLPFVPPPDGDETD
jgi:DNA-binding response OmpR family regulator